MTLNIDTLKIIESTKTPKLLIAEGPDNIINKEHSFYYSDGYALEPLITALTSSVKPKLNGNLIRLIMALQLIKSSYINTTELSYKFDFTGCYLSCFNHFFSFKILLGVKEKKLAFRNVTVQHFIANHYETMDRLNKTIITLTEISDYLDEVNKKLPEILNNY